MEPSSRRWLRLLLLTTLWCQVKMECPTMCRCTDITSESTRIDCSNSRLSSYPKFPVDAIEIILSGNQLSSVRNDSFQSTPYLRRLDLSNNKISIIETGSFANLGSLETLDLSSNHLEDNDFRDHELFRGSRMITDLNLSENRLTGIPGSGLKLLTRLKKISLSYNSVVSAVFGPDFVYLEELGDVDISGNRFDTIPSHAFQVLKSLKSVNISGCGIKEIRPGLFSEVTSLYKFDISDNAGINMVDLNETVKAVCRSPRLSVLRLSNLNITEINHMLDPLINTDELEHLDLSYNSLGYLRSVDLRYPRRLRELNLSHNRLINLPRFTYSLVKKLDLSHNRLQSIEESNMDGLSELEELDISHNLITDFSSKPFSRNFELNTLDISNNRIATITEITHLEFLQILNISGNLITDPTFLFKMLDLKILDASYNAISSLDANMINTKLQLADLDLSYNVIDFIQSDTFKEWTPNNINLAYNKLTSMDDWGLTLVQSLNLSNNDIQFIREQALLDLDWLKVLDLSHNKLTMLPLSMFKHLTAIKRVDLSHNDLGAFMQGPLVTSVFSPPKKLVNLEHLNLENTNIDTIPDLLFAKLLKLDSLDLSNNKLTEVTSQQLKGLGLVMHLDLSNNKMRSFNSTSIESLVNLKTLDISGIKWNCDCDSINEIKKWIDTSDIHIVNYQNKGHYVCDQPLALQGTELYELSLTSQDCSETVMEKTIILIIIGCTSFVILVAAAIIFWQHRWRLKKKLKKQHYRAMHEAQLQGNNGTAVPQAGTNYHHHHHHHHPPSLPSKIARSDIHHQHSGQAFV